MLTHVMALTRAIVLFQIMDYGINFCYGFFPVLWCVNPSTGGNPFYSVCSYYGLFLFGAGPCYNAGLCCGVSPSYGDNSYSGFSLCYGVSTIL